MLMELVKIDLYVKIEHRDPYTIYYFKDYFVIEQKVFTGSYIPVEDEELDYVKENFPVVTFIEKWDSIIKDSDYEFPIRFEYRNKYRWSDKESYSVINGSFSHPMTYQHKLIKHFKKFRIDLIRTKKLKRCME